MMRMICELNFFKRVFEKKMFSGQKKKKKIAGYNGYSKIYKIRYKKGSVEYIEYIGTNKKWIYPQIQMKVKFAANLQMNV